MNKQQIYIGVGIFGALIAGYYFYSKSSAGASSAAVPASEIAAGGIVSPLYMGGAPTINPTPSANLADYVAAVNNQTANIIGAIPTVPEIAQTTNTSYSGKSNSTTVGAGGGFGFGGFGIGGQVSNTNTHSSGNVSTSQNQVVTFAA